MTAKFWGRLIFPFWDFLFLWCADQALVYNLNHLNDFQPPPFSSGSLLPSELTQVFYYLCVCKTHRSFLCSVR